MDNPATHLELTMIHEAMVLEYSGRYLALVEWAAGLKLLVFLTLIVNIFAPWGIATSLAPGALGLGLAVYLVKVSGLAVVIGVIHVRQTRMSGGRLWGAPSSWRDGTRIFSVQDTCRPVPKARLQMVNLGRRLLVTD